MPSRSNERLVLLITSLASFLTPFMSSSVNVALPAIGREFSVSAVALGWVATSFLLAAAVGLVPIGRRRVFTTGLVVYTAGSFLCALAPSHLVLIAFRVVQGSGGAMIFGTATALLTSTFPASGRGRALGWNVASVYTGLSLGPFLGGILTQNLSWRSLFLTNVPLGVVILNLAL
jgi:MFS family permease